MYGHYINPLYKIYYDIWYIYIIYNISIFRNQQKICGIIVDELNELCSPQIGTKGDHQAMLRKQERTADVDQEEIVFDPYKRLPKGVIVLLVIYYIPWYSMIFPWNITIQGGAPVRER